VASYIEGEVVEFESIEAGGEKSKPTPVSHRPVHFTSIHGAVDTPVYDAEALKHTHVIHGPAIVTTENTTYLVEPGWRLEPTVQGAVWLLSD
jgi:N-methylhydantoinase A